MGYSSSPQLHGGDPSSNFGWYVMNRIMKSSDAKADGDIYKAFSFFEDAFHILITFYDLEERRQLQADMETFNELRKQIENEPKLPPQTRDSLLNKLRLSFMEAHRSYLYLALPRTHLYTVSDDGEIEFTKADFETTKKIIRASSLRQNVIEKEGENGAASE
jgi:hypothetical protein